MELRINEHGKISGNVKDVYWSMAITYLKKGDVVKRTEYLKKSLEISEKVYGKKHLETAYAYEALYRQYITQWHDTHENMLLDECTQLLENLIEAKIALNAEESMEVAEWYMEYSDLLRLKND